MAICFDESRGQFFHPASDDDDEFEISYKYGSDLKQIGDDFPFDDKKPKRTN